MRNIPSSILLCILVYLPGISFAADALREHFSMGIVPQQNPTLIAKNWAPVLRYLSEKTGYHVELHTAKDITSFNTRVKSGIFDVVYVNPRLYAVDASANYSVFAKEQDVLLRGIIVVAKNSPITHLDALHDTTMAFPDADAFAATLIPLAFLKKSGIHVTFKYVMSHDSVYRAVAKGLYPAGGGVIKTLEKSDPEIKELLRILWTSPPFTPHPFAAHTRVPQPVVTKLLAAMIGMEIDPVGKKLLKEIGFKGIVAAEDREYDEIRRLKNLMLPAP